MKCRTVGDLKYCIFQILPRTSTPQAVSILRASEALLLKISRTLRSERVDTETKTAKQHVPGFNTLTRSQL